MGIIEKIQNKPDSVKIKIMWVVGIAVVILLIVVWGISYKYRKNIPKDKTLFNTIGDGIKNVKNNFKK